MDILTAKTLSAKLQTSPDYIAREEYEVILLKNIFESEFGSRLVFKGGTALRLAYGSPRYSEDLDFTLIGKIEQSKLKNILKKTAKLFPAIKNVETTDKFNTVFALVKIREPYLKHAFSIKIEISKRRVKWVGNRDYSEKVIRSETTPLTLLARVANLETILHEKKDALKNRNAPRDIFDYWYINQLLKKDVNIDFSRYNKVSVKRELHKLLPKNYWGLVKSWLE